ncbi:MAG: fibronectin type III domain-containing protein [Anaerovoracaceae bacterium]|jgi:hypothetical protein
MKRRKTKSRIGAAVLALAAALAFLPLLPAQAGAAETGSAKVTVSCCNVGAKNQFDLTPRTLTVSGDTAEQYGYTDNGDTSKVTALDAFAAMHAAKYGEAFAAGTAENYLQCSGGWLSRVFGVETMNIGYMLNRATTSTTASETFLNDGDTLEMFRYLDDSTYSDYYTGFTKNAVTAYTGEDVQLTLEGAWPWEGWDKRVKFIGSTAETTDKTRKAVVTAATVADDGSLTSIEGAAPDAEGLITLKFDKPGTYHISASGTVNRESGFESCPITLPWCTVTVRDRAPAAPEVSAAGSTWNSIKVKWQKVQGAKSYRICRAAKKSGSYRKMAEVAGTSWTDKGLTTGKHFYYKVCAVNGSAVSAFSNSDYARCVPHRPELKSAKAGRGSVKLSWTKVKGAGGYAIYQAAKKNGRYSRVRRVGGSKTAAVVKGLRSGRNRYYKVRAFKSVKGRKIFTRGSDARRCKVK